MTGVTQTPNIKLNLVPADFKNWADIVNGNSKSLDAIMSAYFTVQNLQGLWENSTMYAVGDTVVDAVSSVVFKANLAHTSAAVPTTFLQDRTAHASYWDVYSSPARSRGAWLPNTAYALNDFVVSGSEYAICIQTHTSSTVFSADTAAGKWSILVDLSAAGNAVLPVPGGTGDANKFVVLNGGGTGYSIVTPSNALGLLGGTTIGQAVFKAASQADALAAIGATPSGSYQPHSVILDNLVSSGAVNLADLRISMGAYAWQFYNVGNGELGLESSTSLNNIFTLRSNNPNGYAAFAFQDMGGNEHGAYGLSQPGGALNIFPGYIYHEFSNFSDLTAAPGPYILFGTGTYTGNTADRRNFPFMEISLLGDMTFWYPLIDGGVSAKRAMLTGDTGNWLFGNQVASSKALATGAFNIIDDRELLSRWIRADIHTVEWHMDANNLTVRDADAGFNLMQWGLNGTAKVTAVTDFYVGRDTFITRNLFLSGGYLSGVEMADPGASAINAYNMYAEDNGSGKTRLMVRFASGAAQQLAIQP